MRARAVYGGHYVCGLLASGLSRSDVAADVKTTNPVSALGAVDFVSDAVAFYCPEYAGR
jgi:hypothetical protein